MGALATVGYGMRTALGDPVIERVPIRLDRLDPRLPGFPIPPGGGNHPRPPPRGRPPAVARRPDRRARLPRPPHMHLTQNTKQYTRDKKCAERHTPDSNLQPTPDGRTKVLRDAACTQAPVGGRG